MTERDEEISTAMPKDLDALPRRGGFRLRVLEMTRLESFSKTGGRRERKGV